MSGVYTCTICDAVILDKYSLQVRYRIGRRKKEITTYFGSVVDPDQVQDPTFHIISDLVWVQDPPVSFFGSGSGFRISPSI